MRNTSTPGEDVRLQPLPKAPTGITGLDEITLGGLPRGRPTLLCGAAGCGKTLLALAFLVNGALEFGEPGVFVAFEETAGGARREHRLARLRPRAPGGRRLVRHRPRRGRAQRDRGDRASSTSRACSSGSGTRSTRSAPSASCSIPSSRSSRPSPTSTILRAELRRLFRWLKDKGVTAIITAERGERALTRQGLEEYVSDCVILLDHRIEKQIVTRRLTHRQVPRLGPRHRRVSLPHRRAAGSACCRSRPWASTTR